MGRSKGHTVPGSRVQQQVAGHRSSRWSHSPPGYGKVVLPHSWVSVLLLQVGLGDVGTDHFPHLGGELCDCGNMPEKSWISEAWGVRCLFAPLMWRRCRDAGTSPNWMERTTWCVTPCSWGHSLPHPLSLWLTGWPGNQCGSEGSGPKFRDLGWNSICHLLNE